MRSQDTFSHGRIRLSKKLRQAIRTKVLYQFGTRNRYYFAFGFLSDKDYVDENDTFPAKIIVMVVVGAARRANDVLGSRPLGLVSVLVGATKDIGASALGERVKHLNCRMDSLSTSPGVLGFGGPEKVWDHKIEVFAEGLARWRLFSSNRVRPVIYVSRGKAWRLMYNNLNYLSTISMMYMLDM